MTNLSPTSLHESLQVNDDCALPHALNIMGEKWAFMILRASFNGIRHFEGYLAEIGIARNILANRLSRLTENGILIRTPCPKDRRKVEYQLTEKGLDHRNCIQPGFSRRKRSPTHQKSNDKRPWRPYIKMRGPMLDR